MIGLSVSPEVALADEQVKIQVWGLPPREIITLRAWVEDEKRRLFHSRAFYMSDDEGKVDLEHTPATGGDFYGVYPMGLFWALRSTNKTIRLIKRDVIGSPFYVHLEVYCQIVFNPSQDDVPVVSKVIERWYVSPGVQRIKIREGRLRGALFLPPGKGPFPGVIDLFGIAGGLVEIRSSLLASRGFACLALAYCVYEDLPTFLLTVDLEYFEEAIHLLSSHAKVSGDGVGVIGTSKGAEIALAMASYLPQVAATICINGTNAVHVNTLSYRDVLMPGIPFNMERIVVTDRGTIDFTRVMRDTRKPEHQDSIIPLEKARGPILFLVGEKDQNYESLFFAKEALARAKMFNKKNVYLQSYPGAGHHLEPPGSPFCPLTFNPYFPFPMTGGGELLAHCKAQELTWNTIQDFLRKNIPCTQRNKL
ncbi:acyl-coenzyme A amino acid N-acyltransferase 1-like isoform X2 [Hyperolius riggenbachi]